MDYAETLRREIRESHAVFHEFALTISKAGSTDVFLFFEGDEDPSFYMPHIVPRLSGRQHFSFICYGKSEVLKVNNLVERDGRASRRALFFVDKDHTDIIEAAPTKISSSVFQTTHYSIENYLTDEAVFRRFWVERLHLSDTDLRYPAYLELLRRMGAAFEKRGRTLMALVLIGRGIDGLPASKLNLNNVQLDRVLHVNAEAGVCRYKLGALQHFLAASNINAASRVVKTTVVRRVIQRHLLSRAPKSYLRGKYELWFFWKVLTQFSRQLSDRDTARRTGAKRATPTIPMSLEGAVESLAPLIPCPSDLTTFLSTAL